MADEMREASTVSAEPAIEEELLVEEVSIDGMCGVY
ncbi:mycofactocin precursor MftA [Saccharopolyspora sp. ASAGF58]|nr:mycofactocin precursor MftA [Saccharopolyspora sp. ASAGF58]QIZ37958.1 mycofactocin precursor [Saccharopolyspora sp. ASAGF58]